ncbi:hypothetical protein BKA82DRAFT_3984008, partial [Pisolithus tinctorius]
HSREDGTVPVLSPLESGGADVFEVGVPFSNPIAAFKKLTLRFAPQNAADYATMLGAMALRSYILILKCIPPRHADRVLCDARASGFGVEDLQLEEASGFRRNLSYVPLIALSTSLHRLGFRHRFLHLCRFACKFFLYISWLLSEYVYRISQMGSTGSSVQGFVNSEFPDIIARICKHAFIPLAVGFGVATQVHFDAVVEAGAHGVVVGSGIVYLIKEAPAGQVPQVVENFCRGLKGSSPSNSSTAGVQSSQYHYPVVAAISRPTGMRLLLPRFGQYVPEALFDCLIELEEAHNATQNDPMF